MPKLILAQVLKKKRLSKRQFAKLLGMRYDNIFRFFREGYDPKFSLMVRWAKVLKIRLKDLFKE